MGAIAPTGPTLDPPLAVVDGRRIRFWEDKWWGIEPLGVAFPSLYTMVVSIGAFVAETWDHSREVGG